MSHYEIQWDGKKPPLWRAFYLGVWVELRGFSPIQIRELAKAEFERRGMSVDNPMAILLEGVCPAKPKKKKEPLPPGWKQLDLL